MLKLLLLASLLGAPAAVAAQRPASGAATVPADASTAQPAATLVVEPVAMFIAACDADGDARVTRAELTACVARSFASVDPGRSGSIGYIGYSDWALAWLGDRNALPSPFTVDSNGDNRITLVELDTRLATVFARLDHDHDGVVTRAELLTIRTGFQPGGRRAGHDGHGGDATGSEDPTDSGRRGRRPFAD